MGVEVGFRDLKEVTPAGAGIGAFIGGLVHCIKDMGKDDELKMIESSDSTPDAFIKSNVGPCAVDLVQSKHQKTQ
jgi:hypothetical protein